jgi:hypothetical protein
MFVSRVISIWVYMILAPLAFFSYTVPKMQGMKTIGWKNWWSQLLSMSFLAPVFIFFMYLIIKFLETGLGLLQNDSRTGLAFVIGVIIPFAFIMILLMKAKDIAKTMSGELGQKITGGVAAVGGMALGGAALGTAALGRNTIGAFMKGASTGDTAAQRYERGESRGRWDRLKGRVGSTIGMSSVQQSIGRRVNRDQTRVEGYAHARHTLDENAQSRYHKKYEELTQVERQNVHNTIDQNIISREMYGNRTFGQLNNAEQATVTAALPARRAAGIHHGSAELVGQSRGKQGLVSSVVQSSRNGSYDVRNLSKLVIGEKDRGFNKLVTGITSALASGMRSAFKQSNINYGTAQKDLIKDIGNTITDALKSTKVSVDLSHVGHEEKEGDHGHGGGGHH